MTYVALISLPLGGNDEFLVVNRNRKLRLFDWFELRLNSWDA